MTVSGPTGIQKVIEDCQTLNTQLGKISGRYFSVVKSSEKESAEEVHEKLQFGIKNVENSLKNLLVQSNCTDDLKKVPDLLDAYYQLTSTVSKINPENKIFFKKWFYNILEFFGCKLPKFTMLGVENPDIKNKLTSVCATALQTKADQITITSEEFAFGQRKICKSDFNKEKFNAIFKEAQESSAQRPAITSMRSTNPPSGSDIQAILTAVNNELGKYRQNALEKYNFSDKYYEGLGKKDLTESFPLQPGQWFITDLPNNQGIAVVFRKGNEQKNTVYTIQQSSLKSGALVVLPKELQQLDVVGLYTINDSAIKSWAGQHQLGSYLETVKSTNLSKEELQDVQKYGLLKSCWECEQPSASFLSTLFSGASKDIRINKYDDQGRKTTFILRREGEGVRVWENQVSEKISGTLHKTRGELEKFLGTASVKDVKSRNQSLIQAGTALIKDSGFLGIGQEGETQLANLKAKLIASNSEGEFYSLRKLDGTSFQLELNWLDSKNVLCSETKNIQIQLDGKLLIGDKEYSSFQEYMDFDGAEALKSTNFGVMSQTLALYEQYRQELAVFFSDSKIPNDIAFWAINQEPGFFSEGNPAVVIISQNATNSHEFVVDDKNRLDFKLPSKKKVDSLMEGVSSLAPKMNPYKIFKTKNMIKTAQDQLVKMNESSPAKVTRGDTTYQIYTKSVFGQPNQGELYVVEGSNLIKLKYALRLNEKMQLTMIIEGREKNPLVIGDYEKGGALGFQPKRLGELLELAVPTSLKTTTKVDVKLTAKPVSAEPVATQSVVIKSEEKTGPGFDAEKLFSDLEFDLYAKDDNPANELNTKLFKEDPVALVSLIANTPKTKLKQLAERVREWSEGDKLLLAAVCMVPEEDGKSIPALDLFACHVMNQIEESPLKSIKADNSKIAFDLFSKIKHTYGTNPTYGKQFHEKLRALRNKQQK